MWSTHWGTSDNIPAAGQEILKWCNIGMRHKGWWEVSGFNSQVHLLLKRRDTKVSWKIKYWEIIERRGQSKSLPVTHYITLCVSVSLTLLSMCLVLFVSHILHTYVKKANLIAHFIITLTVEVEISHLLHMVLFNAQSYDLN